MITNYASITETELGVLQRQLERSPFFTHPPNQSPKRLAIFDFDSTLFFSPLLSPTIWHPNLIRVATAESVYGPGWWRDIRSLDLGPTDQLQKTAWEGYWNERIVAEARECINDPDVMTVVLTGRRYHPFHHIIPLMLTAKGLMFDVIGLRPDPEQVSEDHHWQISSGHVCYNLSPSVFDSTMHFKTCFILNVLHNIPSIEEVTMWDDRMPHVKRFKDYLWYLTQYETIKKGHVVYVPGIRPKYNPTWEKSVIAHIIQTHNKALLAHRYQGLDQGKIEQRAPYLTEDPLDASQKPLRLVPLPAATIVRLPSHLTQQLKDTFTPHFKAQFKINGQTAGEALEFFGDAVYLSHKEALNNRQLPIHGNLGDKVKMTVCSYSKSSLYFILHVKIDRKKFILPLWFKPSEYHDVFNKEPLRWIPVNPPVSITGHIDHAYRLGVVEKPLEKRSSLADEEEEEISRPSVRIRS
ncbi:Uncharacterized protein C4.02c [Choanephora cucurbitarum]|uniref:Uncharacterized protein C4.02c n=1 Tax=Choanephora cucurbitarum TaxID=101091 RepID=A0A1C7NGR6_9FUNG|nr:Uncharacterized protein C4.02c [Choanephora cucurbitarum]